jgi:serine/threonine protein kinase
MPVNSTPVVRNAVPDIAVSVRERLAKALGPKFEVRGTLGKGGFAEVFEVFDTDLHRRLAVKVLHPDIAWTGGMLERFKQEARTLARLDHPNILPIHFVGEGEGLVYYAMPLVEGETVADLMRSKPALPVDQALGIVRPVLDALAHAHSMGLVHRDIKPENILIQRSNGRVLLVDFGIAKQIGDAAGGLTQTGFTLGTPHYMAPEQALGQGDLDHRADLYSTGAVLYQMVTGAPPYEGESSQEIVGKHIAEPVPRPSARNARIPAWLSDVIVRLLAKRPDERYQSATAVLDALNAGRASGKQGTLSADDLSRRIQSEEKTAVLPSQERPVTPVAPPVVTPPRRKMGWTLPLLALAVLVAVFLFLRGGPVLLVKNQLVEPIRVVVGDSTAQIAEGQERRLRLPRGNRLFVQWYLVQPMGPGGLPLGEPMQGTLRQDKVRGQVILTVTNRTTDGTFFAPLISNNTDRSLRAIVNAGLRGASDCGCGIPAGSTRTRIGYYRLYQNSTLRVVDGGGRSAMFADLGAKVLPGSGSVGLRFNTGDLK